MAAVKRVIRKHGSNDPESGGCWRRIASGDDLMNCVRCQDTRWTCESHPDKPMARDGCLAKASSARPLFITASWPITPWVSRRS